VTVSLNWTKVGLKGTSTIVVDSDLDSLNWTKVGLKEDATMVARPLLISCLNWTKVGLKVLSADSTI